MCLKFIFALFFFHQVLLKYLSKNVAVSTIAMERNKDFWTSWFLVFFILLLGKAGPLFVVACKTKLNQAEKWIKLHHPYSVPPKLRASELMP